jgi:hypothetical protein
MPSVCRPIATATPLARAPLARVLSVAALLAATALATPLTAARAASADAAQFQLAQATPPSQPTSPAPAATAPASQAAPQAAPQPQSGDTAAETKPETVDERITSLHAALQITPQQEAKWDRVAQVMRDNAAAMQKLMAERDSQAGNITAVQDLQEYEKFAQAHITGLRKLIVSFDILYKSMPDAQKKVADQVFEDFGHHHPAAAVHS